MSWLRLLRPVLPFVFALVFAGPATAEWHASLALDGGGWWRGRIRVVVENAGSQAVAGALVRVPIGGGAGQADLEGQAAESVRVCDGPGVEMLFEIQGPTGEPITRGPIPAGSTLVFPVECDGGTSAEYYVYFDNPEAWELPDLLRGRGRTRPDAPALQGMTRLKGVAEKPDRRMLAEAGEPAWLPAASAAARRALIRLIHAGPEAIPRSLVCADLGVLERRSSGQNGSPGSLAVFEGAAPLAYTRLGNLVLFEAALPPRTVRTWHGYQPWPLAEAGESGMVPAWSLPHNLVTNPSFESGAPYPDGWSHDTAAPGSNITFGIDDPGRRLFGKRCLKMAVPPEAPEAWRGWRQTVAVTPGKTYLLAGWVKCRDITGGEVRLHAHRRTADGGLSRHEPMMSVGPGIRGTTDWTLMSGLTSMPGDATRLELHLTMNAHGTVWYDGVVVAEVLPATVARIEGRPLAGSAGVAVWQVPAVVKVFEDDPAPQAPRAIPLGAARNEREPLQLAIRSGVAIPGVRVEADPPAGPQGQTLGVEVNVVGFVPIDYPTSYYRSVSPAWHRKRPSAPPACDGWPGRWPDPLLPRDTFDLAANTTQPVWITVKVPKGVPAGDYVGRVRLVASGRRLADWRYTVHVWDFTLPDESHVGAIYDVRTTGGERWWGKPAEEATRDVVRFMAERRLCPDSVQPFPVIDYENGRVVTDFAAFDRAAAWYFDELKIPFSYTPRVFYLFGWGLPPRKKFGEDPYPGEWPYPGADRSQLRPEFKKAYQACLKAFWDHIKEKGWEKKFVLYIADEPFDAQPQIREQMKALCRMIHEVDPRIPIYCSTWKHVPEWDASLDVWGIGHYGVVPPERMAKLREHGARLWLTTDGHMCTDTPYCAIERLLPHYCFHYGAEAYEFWGVNWYTYDPFRYGWHAYIPQSDQPGKSYWVRYPNGDGFLLYPGGLIGHPGPISSIRLEQAREGVEDYEYLHLLHRRIAAAKASGREVSAAERAMAQAAALVTIPNPGGRYSSKILPDPAALDAARRAVAAAIEGKEL